MSHYLYNKGETLKYERGFSLSNFLGELMTDIVKYGFYTVDPDYLEYLNGIDSEVYYTSSYRNTIKPFVEIVVGIGSYNYFIPVSSAKEKHKKWKNVSDEHFLIYELVDNSININGDIYKYYSNEKKCT